VALAHDGLGTRRGGRASFLVDVADERLRRLTISIIFLLLQRVLSLRRDGTKAVGTLWESVRQCPCEALAREQGRGIFL
jgi:hypothetical protein